MVDVQNRLTDLREEAYAKVLRCLPYPRQWVCRSAPIDELRTAGHLWGAAPEVSGLLQ